MTYPDDRYYYNRYTEPARPAPVSRSDGDIKSDVVNRLRENVHTAPHTLEVNVQSGVVILAGEVSTPLAKRAAGDDSWDTPGVVDVSNQLLVVPGS
jgi:osmotically-inducible protein OsmY